MQSMVVNLGILLLCLPLRGWAQSGDSLPINMALAPIHQYNSISAERFNQGLITDPLQLVQAKLPGLLSTRAGNDPNGVFDSQIRGLKTFGNPNPFYLVDGMPVADLSGIHPADIERVEIVAAGTSLWSGMRAGNGILQIHTRQGQEGTWQLRYRQMRASERMTRDPGMMSAIEFRRAGGSLATDPGTEANWWKEITRRASSATHHLSLSGGNEQSVFYASAAYDRIEGIGLASGFDRLNGRLNFRQMALNDRLEISTSINLLNRRSTLSPYWAFLQATQYNPTAPIYGEDPAYDAYGGFYQALIFNNYNPVAILQQNQFDQTYRNLQAYLKMDYTLIKGLKVGAVYQQQTERLHLSSFSPSNSFYLGWDRNGLAAQHQTSQNNEYGALSLTYSGVSKDWTWQLGGRAFAQNLEWKSLRLETSDFLTNTFTYNNLGAGQSTANGQSFIDNSRLIQSFRGLGANGRLDYQSRWGLAASIHYEGASHLGSNQRWGLFYGATAYAKLNDHWRLQASLSQTGNVPERSLLSQDIYRGGGNFNRFPWNGVFQETFAKEQEGNPDLRSERVREFTLGTQFSLWDQRLGGSLNFYANRADHLIVRHWLDRSVNLAAYQYRNSGVLSNAGLEFNLQYDLLRKENFTWRMELSGARYFPSKVVRYYDDPAAGDFRTGIIGGAPIFWIADGETLGAIRGHRFLNDNPVAPDGNWNFWDRNRDGYFGPEDYFVIGNARPSMQFGWTNRLSKGHWRLDFMLRGVFGHDIVQHTKSLHSPPLTVNVYNGWAAGVRELLNLEAYPHFSERDVEKGSFLRLDYLALHYTLDIKNFSSLQLFVAVQNLFTISGYSGVNPEYRMVDRNLRNPLSDTPLNAFAYTGAPLVQGMDRRNTYPLSRTFSIGLQLGIE